MTSLPEFPPYSYKGPVDCDIDFLTAPIQGQTAIVTGGAKGLGEAYTKALVEAGVYVVIGDIDETYGKALEIKHPSHIKYVACDVSKWQDQVDLFKAALTFSPKNRIDIVVANAAIAREDDDFFYHDVQQNEPIPPRMDVLKTDVVGTLYTIKLALHTFHRQRISNKESHPDYNLVITTSMGAYTEMPTLPLYATSKYAIRGLWRCLRTTEPQHGIRVNMIAPHLLKTTHVSKSTKPSEQDTTTFATVEDTAACLLRIVCDRYVIGRTLAVGPRTWAPRGYFDLDQDDYQEGILREVQLDAFKQSIADSRFSGPRARL